MTLGRFRSTIANDSQSLLAAKQINTGIVFGKSVKYQVHDEEDIDDCTVQLNVSGRSIEPENMVLGIAENG